MRFLMLCFLLTFDSGLSLGSCSAFVLLLGLTGGPVDSFGGCCVWFLLVSHLVTSGCTLLLIPQTLGAAYVVFIDCSFISAFPL